MTPEKQSGGDMSGQTTSANTGSSTTQASTSGQTTYPGQSTYGSGATGTSSGTTGMPSTQQTMGSSEQGMADQAKEKASEMAGRAQEKTMALADQAKHQLSSQVATQKDRAAESLGSIRQVLNQTSSNLREQNQDAFAGYVDQLGAQVENLTGYLRNHSVQDLISDAERLARREPALFLGGAVLLGLFGARFFKSSNPQPDVDRGFYGGSSYGRSEYGGDYGRTGYRGYERNIRYDRDRPSEQRFEDTERRFGDTGRYESHLEQNMPYGATRSFGDTSRPLGDAAGSSLGDTGRTSGETAHISSTPGRTPDVNTRSTQPSGAEGGMGSGSGTDIGTGTSIGTANTVGGSQGIVAGTGTGTGSSVTGNTSRMMSAMGKPQNTRTSDDSFDEGSERRREE